MMTDIEIARVVMEALMGYRLSEYAHGPLWELWLEQDTNLTMLVMLIKQGFANEALHDAWVNAMYEQGWRVGPTDRTQCKHSEMVSYRMTSPAWKLRYRLMQAIVATLTDASNFQEAVA